MRGEPIGMSAPSSHLISYIAPAAPATRRPATGDEPFIRPVVGFTPKWYRQHLNIDFGQRWHADPAYRRPTVLAMREDLRRRFRRTVLERYNSEEGPLDLLTGIYGTCTVAAIYGATILYAEDCWPQCGPMDLSDEQVDTLQPPKLDENPFFQQLMDQVDWIARSEGQVVGYLNWQGVLNNALRMRGQQLLLDLFDRPDRVRRLFEGICQTMIEAARRLHARQRLTGVTVDFFTVSNCLVNLISPGQYREFLMPSDRRIAAAFGRFGVHNCAWSATPYLDLYAALPNVRYIDMGIESDLAKAKRLFPATRRAIMYTPTDLKNKTFDQITSDLDRIAREYAPCDLVFADIEAGTPDERIREVFRLCDQLNDLYRGLPTA